MRNFLFDKRILKIASASRPVISIGNLTAGGTGKTPLVVWMCRYLNDLSCHCGVLTRGYKAGKGKMTDEPAIVAKCCDNVEIVVDSDRVTGAQKAVERFGCDVLVMDDGFQHRRLRRDLDIITIDCTCPFGYDRILPAGLLREPKSSIQRAQVVILTRCNHISAEMLDNLEDTISRINPDAVIGRTIHSHSNAVTLGGKKMDLDELKGRKVFLFCGIGNPDAFVEQVRQAGFEICGTEIFNDHYRYTEKDVDALYETAGKNGADCLLTTQKDWAKTALFARENRDILFAYLSLEIVFTKGREAVEERIRTVIGK